MSGWLHCTIGDQITLQRGVDITKRDTRFGNVPVISSGGISTYHDTAIDEGPGVVIGRKGSLGTVYWASGRYWPHDTTLWVKDFKGNDRRFVYYFLTTLDTKGLDVGSSNPTLNRNHVHPLPVAWPPLTEQYEIASILGALDDKIELNRKTAATLEEMARVLYRSWFVDFEPVWAKAQGRTPVHMDEATAALFPNSFGDDGLPVGWHICALQDHITFKSGKTWPTSLRSENGSAIAYGANGPVGRSSSGLGHGRVIFIGKIGSCGALNYFNGNFWATNNAYYVTSSETESLEYARQVLNEIDWAQYVGGSSNPYMPLKNFDHLTCTVPSCELLSAFEAKASSLRAKIEGFSEEAITLSNLRDALLPKLMSGELRVGAAQQLVEAVA